MVPVVNMSAWSLQWKLDASSLPESAIVGWQALSLFRPSLSVSLSVFHVWKVGSWIQITS
jgi:hypothetical protein